MMLGFPMNNKLNWCLVINTERHWVESNWESEDLWIKMEGSQMKSQIEHWYLMKPNHKSQEQLKPIRIPICFSLYQQ